MFINLSRHLLGWILLPILLCLPFFRRRWSLETQWISEKYPQEANLAVHISSEGELEQVLPLLTDVLNRGPKNRLQILFTSPSVGPKVKRFAEKMAGRVDYRMVPLVRYSWGSAPDLGTWVKAPLFLMVRYDFFPELILLGSRVERFGLLSATLKGKYEQIQGGWRRWYWRSLLGQFDFILSATEKDAQVIKALTSELSSPSRVENFELRTLQVIERLEGSESHLEALEWFDRLRPFFMTYPRQKRLIIGSAWEQDVALLGESSFKKKILSGELGVYIAPHLLDRPTLNDLKQQLQAMGLKVAVFDGKEPFPEEAQVVISAVPGILCEMYELFDFIYVGGGFGRSIHSVWEPFWSGAELFLGPKTHRSTEFDLAKEYGAKRVHRIEKADEFYLKWEEAQTQVQDRQTFLNFRREFYQSCQKDWGRLVEELRLA